MLAGSPDPLVVWSGIEFAYEGSDRNAIGPVDLCIRAGESVSIVGQSGSGKSTMLSVLGLLDPPTAGSYRLDGVEVSALGDRAASRVRRDKIGFVFQAFHLIESASLLENVRLGLRYCQDDRYYRDDVALTALDLVGLGGRATSSVAQLSGGERQRVAIARAFAKEPTIMLADEPTGNLDKATSDEIMALFLEMVAASQSTLVLVTHDPTVASQVDRTIRVEGGRTADVVRS